MNYKILAVLSDISDLEVKKVPEDLFNEIYVYIKQKFNPNGISAPFRNFMIISVKIKKDKTRKWLSSGKD